MALARRPENATHGYTVDEVARFLQYDSEAVRYWLRTGHLVGQIDAQSGDWRVPASELVSFLRQSTEPMPTGVAHTSRPSHQTMTVSSATLARAAQSSTPPEESTVHTDREAAIAGSRVSRS
jgi:hypothetical protein